MFLILSLIFVLITFCFRSSFSMQNSSLHGLFLSFPDKPDSSIILSPPILSPSLSLSQAPEFFLEHRPVTPKVDVFSIGVLFYLMIFGRYPFSTSSIGALTRFIFFVLICLLVHSSLSNGLHSLICSASSTPLFLLFIFIYPSVLFPFYLQ